jgi:DNA-binding transcriptional LysR family regulator
MNLKQMRHVAAVAELGSFSRAAEKLGVPQPVLSRSIKAMEGQFAVVLFERGRFGARLTTRGHTLLQGISEILERCETLESELLNRQGTQAEEITIGASPLPAATLLSKVIAAAISDEPWLKINLQVQATEVLIDHLVEGTMCFAVCLEHNVPTTPGLRMDRIGTVQTGCIVRKGHPLLARPEVTLADIARYPTAGSPTATPGHQASVSCNDHQVQKDVVRASDAIWFASPLLIGRADGLVELKVAGPPIEPRHISVITRANHQLAPAASALVGRLRAAAHGLQPERSR